MWVPEGPIKAQFVGVSFSLIASVSKCTPDINTSPKQMYTRARSKERFDFTRHYGLGNSVRGVARAIALAALRTDLFVRRYALKNALGRVSNAREPVHNVNAGSVDASLKGANVGTVDLRSMRQFLWRQAVGPPAFPQIECQNLSYFHARGQLLEEYFTTEYSRQRCERNR